MLEEDFNLNAGNFTKFHIFKSLTEQPLTWFGSLWDRFELMPMHFLMTYRHCGLKLQLFGPQMTLRIVGACAKTPPEQ